MRDALPLPEILDIPGLAAPADIRIDRWGIAHLSASSAADLFFLQGFNAARDRLWQIDLWRKRGLGLLAADFGPGYLAQDYASRLLLYHGDMAAEWSRYGPDMRTICGDFTRGINAYVALTNRRPELLPPEFGRFGTHPARWSPADVVRIRSHALTRNLMSEVLRANVLARADAQTDLLRRSLDPPATTEPAAGIDLAEIPLDVLDLFKLGTAPVTFQPERLDATLDQAWRWVETTDLGDMVQSAAHEGSNNWVVHGSRTRSGRPILANDPHRTYAVPSLRYLVHLSMPGFDAVGAGEPAVPGISIGHNGTLAFGLTIFGTDQEDLHVCQTDPDDPGRFRVVGGWERIRRQSERFEVKGCAPQELDLGFTSAGPILKEDREGHRLFVLRTVWTEPGSAAYLGSIAAMGMESVRDFGRALRHWRTPSVNFVCADTKGDIAWFVAGAAPVRRRGNGLLPVPGDGSHDWTGFLPADALPRAINPAKGFFVTANEMNLPDGWSQEEKRLGHEWADDSRAHRLDRLLASDPAHDLDASCRMQTDTRSLPALSLAQMLRGLAGRDGEEQAALALLAGWDGNLTAASPQAALAELWWVIALRPALLARLVPDPALRVLVAPGDVTTLLRLLEGADSRLPAADRDRLLLSTLGEACRDARRRLGPDPLRWSWGQLHHAYFEHATSRVTGKSGFDVGPLPLGGSGVTPMNAGYRLPDFRTITGASVRLVIPVGDWDESRCINAPGQSGDPASPHYRDLAPLWSEGRYVPLLYSAPRIAAETIRHIQLRPHVSSREEGP